MSPVGRGRQGGETRGPWAALHLRPPPAAPDSQVSGRSQRRGEGGKGATRVPCLEGGSTTNTEKRFLRDTLGHSLRTAPLRARALPSPAGTQHGPWPEATALGTGWFPLFAEQAEGPGEPAYSTEVSLSSFYSGGLNEGFGWPGRGGSSRLPTEPPFSPRIKYLLSPS